MGFFKSLFGGSQSSEDKRKDEDSKNFETLKYDGVRALKQGQFGFAIKCFTHALDIQEDLECRDYLSQAYMHADELAPAFEQLQLLGEAQPQNTAIFIRMAEVCYMMEDYDAMAAACEKAMETDKENPIVLFNYARACNGQGNPISAIALLTKAIALKEDFGTARLMRGDLLMKMGDIKGATEDAEWLEQAAEGDEDVLLLVARIAEKAGDHDKAIADYGRVIDADPFCVAAFKERGAIRLAQGDAKGAEEDMRSVLELDPKMAEGVSGDYSAEGIESKVKAKYRSMDPYGIFSE